MSTLKVIPNKFVKFRCIFVYKTLENHIPVDLALSNFEVLKWSN